MNTTELVVEIRPEKKTISSLVFITARITYIRFLTAVHIDDFHMFTVSILKHSGIRSLQRNCCGRATS